MLKSLFEANRIGPLIAYILLVNDVTFVALFWQSSAPKVIIIHHSVRFLFIACAITFARARKHSRFYVAGFREMPDSTYWFLVHFIVLVIESLFMYLYFDTSPELRYFNATFIVGYTLALLVAYQIKPWALESQQRRNRRLQALIKKARLSDRELALIAPVLADNVKRAQRVPTSWRIIKWISALILASLLTIYASDIVNLISKIDFLSGLWR